MSASVLEADIGRVYFTHEIEKEEGDEKYWEPYVLH
jgi:hypothetical protein